MFFDLIDTIPSFYDDIGRGMHEKHLIPSDILRAASILHRSNRIVGTLRNELVETSGINRLNDARSRKKPSTFFLC